MSPHRLVPRVRPRRTRLAIVLAVIAAAAMAVGAPLQAAPDPGVASTGEPLGSAAEFLRISQVYGGGGNSGAPYQCDFIEIFNTGGLSVSLSGLSVQYAGASSTSWQATGLSGTVAPGAYMLVQEACGDTSFPPIPTPDATGTLSLAVGSGKVALVNATTPLSGQGLGDTNVIDFIGYGSASSCEGSPPGTCTTKAPTLSNTTAALRAGEGCTDTNNNTADFTAATPNPRNSSSPTHSCGGATNTPAPTDTPTTVPTHTPTLPPPTVVPTDPPTATSVPTAGPTNAPTASPTVVPTTTATLVPSPTPTPVPDGDGDGVLDAIENGAPNGGDGDGDGLPDRSQANVASVPNVVNGDYLTLVAPPGTALAQVAAVGNPGPGDPAILGVTFPVGFVAFHLAPMPAPPSGVTVALLLANGVTSGQYWRYGPEPAPGNGADHWYRFDPVTGSPVTGATYAATTRWDLTFVDGARGDDDLAANGVLVDQGGPGQGGSNPVQLARFDARRVGRAVVLEWATVTEIKHAGFRLWRETPEGGLAPLGPPLIPAQGSELGGATYRRLDVTAPRETVRYWLEDVSTVGTAARHGPAVAPSFRGRAIGLPPRPGVTDLLAVLNDLLAGDGGEVR
jgi:hypothetical protein